ncbi:MAG: GTPase HflX [Vicinamibacterales bacterium]
MDRHRPAGPAGSRVLVVTERRAGPATRAFLMGLALPAPSGSTVDENLDELAELARSTGLTVVGRAVQNRRAPDARTFIGRGKAAEIARAAAELDADVVIFDDDLTPNQVKNLEEIIPCAVIDRSGLILDLFVRQARTREARTQVELAQVEYQLPRLTRRWTHLSRQVGGIGARGGEGETQLEADRRMLRTRIKQLKKELATIERTRVLHRHARAGKPIVALVGYTNAGKSTLFNRLTRAGVLAEDKLFATLDARLRAGSIGGHDTAIFVDTVGFIRKLPHDLVASFRSTLEETLEADLVLHVVDVSHPRWQEQMEVGAAVLAGLGVDMDRVTPVFNKIDRTGDVDGASGGRLAVSALTGAGVDALKAWVRERLAAGSDRPRRRGLAG